MRKNNTKRIQKFLEEIEWMFELNNFERHLVEAKEQPEEHPLLAAEVTPDMIYKEMTITLYPHFWTLPLEAQRKALLHELVHTMIQDTKMVAIDLLHGELHTESDIKQINEKTTSFVTYLLDYLLTGYLRYAKRAYKNYLK